MDPYKPPESDLEDHLKGPKEGDLAKKTTRLWASLIDTTIGIIVTLPFWYFFGFFEMIQGQQMVTLEFTIYSAIYGFITMALVHGYFWHQNGQSIGKKLLNIKITSLDGQNPGLIRILMLRVLPLSFLPFIPVAGNWLPTIDVLFIFRKDRRCIHDFIASTKVVKA